MALTDKQGRIFGKINIIDFLVFVFILCITSGLIILPKLIIARERRMAKEQARLKQVYIVSRFCPNCGKPIIIDTIEGKIKGIPLGEACPQDYKTTCKWCGNPVVLNKSKPKPKPILPATNWMQAEAEYDLKEKDPEHYKRLLEQGKP